MSQFTVNSIDLIPASHYPKIADNLEDCQTYLYSEQLHLKEMYHDYVKEELKEKAEEKRALRLIEQRKSLEDKEWMLQQGIAREIDPERKETLQAELKTTEGMLWELNLKLKKEGKGNVTDVLRANTKAIFLDTQYKAYRKAIVMYLEDYVSTGVIGEGTVTFFDMEFTASAVAQN
ncbi:hypothetical protein FUAX_07040 [Fulvitalea axinellae]|uniref:Uncharacterized protein n=1 Tax=Fulvitalea axinellae TaxID=1182444 RepID=A0AAU9CSC6_9BACT|nr:hypothetical protein FUAX_07040 [Fulvitalea axinellae]